MDGSIFIVNEDGTLVELNEENYDSESILQDLLAQYPNLLAGNQIDPDDPRKWILVSKELPIPDDYDSGGRYSLDHLFLDQDAIPTLVEVKRHTDSRIRREVVAQMLDYAANSVSFLSVERMQTLFTYNCEKSNKNPDVVLAEFLENKSAEEYWFQVKTNLQAGRIRLIFVADKIPTELARIVEFLNNQMDPAEVLAVEIPRFRGGNIVTLVPRVIGQTSEARRKKSDGIRETHQWDKESFLSELQKNCNAEEFITAKRLMDWSEKNLSRAIWGRGHSMGSFMPVLDYNGVSYGFFVLWTYGAIEMQFQYLKQKPPFDRIDMRNQLRSKLNEIKNVDIPEDGIERRPSFKVSMITEESQFNIFISAMNWAISMIKDQS